MNLNNLQSVFSNLVFGILFFSMIIYWFNLFVATPNLKLDKFGQFSIYIANILIFLILGLRWITSGYFPLSNLYESLLFLTWALLAVYLYVEKQIRTKLFGAILIPLTLLICGFSNLTLPLEMQKSSPLVPALQSNWLMMHVSMMMISYATLLTGSLLCILFLVISNSFNIDLNILKKLSTSFYNIIWTTSFSQVNKEIKSEKFLELGKLKLLQSLDNWSYRIIGLGFPFLTLGIIAGGIWANEAWGSYWSWDPKETWALITWLIFAIYLHARITKGWEGTKTAILGSLGFIIIWICYLGVNFLGKGLHSYGWLS